VKERETRRVLERDKACVGEGQGVCWRETRRVLERDKACVGERQGVCWRETRRVLERDKACFERCFGYACVEAITATPPIPEADTECGC
jgi:hypothetical protein